jgi:hypothetical protein
MDFAGTVSVSRKQCFTAGPPLRHLIGICMFVPHPSYLFMNQTSFIFFANLLYFPLDTYGLFNYLLPGPSFYSKIEGLSALVSFA